MNGRPWTEPDLALLAAMYPHSPTAEVARALGRPIGTVYAAASSRGIRKTEAFLASDKAGRIQRGRTHPRMVSTQFRKGQESWTKGTKGVVGVQEGCKATQFKKGEMAGAAQRNYKPVGTLRVNADGILERNVTDDHPVPARRWVAVARLVWEAEHGPIPADHIVRFKQGMATTDPALVTLDRIECISRVENMRRNSYHTNYPPEVRGLVQLRGALTRQINKASKALESK